MATIECINLCDLTNSTSWLTTDDLSNHIFTKLDCFNNGALLKIEFNSIVSLDWWIKESDVTTIMAVTIVDTFFTNCNVLYLKEFILSFFLLDWHKFETTFWIINESEEFVTLWNFNNILETNWESFVVSWLTININIVLSDDDTSFSHITS